MADRRREALSAALESAMQKDKTKLTPEQVLQEQGEQFGADIIMTLNAPVLQEFLNKVAESSRQLQVDTQTQADLNRIQGDLQAYIDGQNLEDALSQEAQEKPLEELRGQVRDIVARLMAEY